jgi:hypothetical protein
VRVETLGTSLTINRREPAGLAVTTAETTIRFFGKLKKGGIVSPSASTGETRILDMERLYERSGWRPYASQTGAMGVMSGCRDEGV